MIKKGVNLQSLCNWFKIACTLVKTGLQPSFFAPRSRDLIAKSKR